MRARTESVSWLEAASLTFPVAAALTASSSGLSRRISLRPSGPDRSMNRASYSGGAAPDLHRLPDDPIRGMFLKGKQATGDRQAP
jgi:hypothetical protein